MSKKNVHHKKNKPDLTRSPKTKIVRFPRLLEDYPDEAIASGTKLSVMERRRIRAKIEAKILRLLGNRTKLINELGSRFGVQLRQI
jgi:hypothetical protein